MSEAKPKPPIHDELLDRGIGLLEGPVNRLAERVLSSTVVLAPLSLSMTLAMRGVTLLRGALKHDTQHGSKHDARRPQ